MIFGKKRQQVMGVKTVKIVSESSCFAEPLAIEFTPERFTPTSIRDGEMDPVWVDAMPILGGDEVSQWIFVAMGSDFRITSSTRCE